MFLKYKLWITKDLKALLSLLNEKKRAFSGGNQEKEKLIQRELKVKIRENTGTDRMKVDHKLEDNSMKEMWAGMRTMRTKLQHKGPRGDRPSSSAV